MTRTEKLSIIFIAFIFDKLSVCGFIQPETLDCSQETIWIMWIGIVLLVVFLMIDKDTNLQ